MIARFYAFQLLVVSGETLLIAIIVKSIMTTVTMTMIVKVKMIMTTMMMVMMKMTMTTPSQLPFFCTQSSHKRRTYWKQAFIFILRPVRCPPEGAYLRP